VLCDDPGNLRRHPAIVALQVVAPIPIVPAVQIVQNVFRIVPELEFFERLERFELTLLLLCLV
jgi:hypothetical protein